ncbi:hypothetical protein HKX48_001823 [Thoreauomyces humboldtii]|nr:hypothetical protein HKX48_001823 [Thoreauomyces humboldtii]
MQGTIMAPDRAKLPPGLRKHLAASKSSLQDYQRASQGSSFNFTSVALPADERTPLLTTSNANLLIYPPRLTTPNISNDQPFYPNPPEDRPSTCLLVSIIFLCVVSLVGAALLVVLRQRAIDDETASVP